MIVLLVIVAAIIGGLVWMRYKKIPMPAFLTKIAKIKMPKILEGKPPTIEQLKKLAEHEESLTKAIEDKKEALLKQKQERDEVIKRINEAREKRQHIQDELGGGDIK